MKRKKGLKYMIQKLKNIAASFALVFAFGAPALAPVAVYAQSDTIQQGLNCGSSFDVSSATGGTSNCAAPDATTTGNKLNDIIKLVINIFSLIVGVVAVIMIIIGGLKYITSGGDSGNVTGAKNTILYAIIGLVVVALSQFIVRFVLAKVTTSS
jgi:hypothetical protein